MGRITVNQLGPKRACPGGGETLRVHGAAQLQRQETEAEAQNHRPSRDGLRSSCGQYRRGAEASIQTQHNK